MSLTLERRQPPFPTGSGRPPFPFPSSGFPTNDPSFFTHFFPTPSNSQSGSTRSSSHISSTTPTSSAISSNESTSSSSASTSSSSSSTSSSSSQILLSHKTPVGTIAGATVGGVALLCILFAGCILFLRRRRSRRKEDMIERAIRPLDIPERARQQSIRRKQPPPMITPISAVASNEVDKSATDMHSTMSEDTLSPPVTRHVPTSSHRNRGSSSRSGSRSATMTIPGSISEVTELDALRSEVALLRTELRTSLPLSALAQEQPPQYEN